ncbi:MAG: SDR family NAD(P)-dependent oxidoreductase [Myxococcota bacterium]
MEFDGQAVVITGGGGGLGRAVVRRMLDLGAEVHVPAFSRADSAALEDTAARVTTDVDLSDEDQVRGFYGAVPKLYASIHLAGGFSMGPLAETDVADLERLWNMNVRTTWLCAREAARRIEGEGRIVNVSARPALHPAPLMATYAATKAAVAALTTNLAAELEPRRIWVNAIVPSIIDTPTNRAAMPGADTSSWSTPDAIAETIAFLASPANAATHGSLVHV